jgi:hypothetical protein
LGRLGQNFGLAQTSSKFSSVGLDGMTILFFFRPFHGLRRPKITQRGLKFFRTPTDMDVNGVQTCSDPNRRAKPGPCLFGRSNIPPRLFSGVLLSVTHLFDAVLTVKIFGLERNVKTAARRYPIAAADCLPTIGLTSSTTCCFLLRNYACVVSNLLDFIICILNASSPRRTTRTTCSECKGRFSNIDRHRRETHIDNILVRYLGEPPSRASRVRGCFICARCYKSYRSSAGFQVCNCSCTLLDLSDGRQSRTSSTATKSPPLKHQVKMGRISTPLVEKGLAGKSVRLVRS